MTGPISFRKIRKFVGKYPPEINPLNVKGAPLSALKIEPRLIIPTRMLIAETLKPSRCPHFLKFHTPSPAMNNKMFITTINRIIGFVRFVIGWREKVDSQQILILFYE